MSQITLTGRAVNGQQLFTSANGSFKKQTIIIEVVNGTYTSYFPLEFHNADVDTFLSSGQVQMGQTYAFTGWLQGSNQQMTDKNGQPTAYLSVKVTAVAPAQSALPNTAAQTAPNAFQQPQQQQGGFVGQPAQQQQPAPQQGFGQQAAPAPNFGGGQANTAPAQGGGFAAPAQGANPFGAPQQ